MKSKYFNRLYILIGLVLAVLMIEGFSGGVVYAAGYWQGVPLWQPGKHLPDIMQIC